MTSYELIEAIKAIGYDTIKGDGKTHIINPDSETTRMYIFRNSLRVETKNMITTFFLSECCMHESDDGTVSLSVRDKMTSIIFRVL